MRVKVTKEVRVRKVPAEALVALRHQAIDRGVSLNALLVELIVKAARVK